MLSISYRGRHPVDLASAGVVVQHVIVRGGFDSEDHAYLVVWIVRDGMSLLVLYCIHFIVCLLSA
jgi:hypothetical protein